MCWESDSPVPVGELEQVNEMHPFVIPAIIFAAALAVVAIVTIVKSIQEKKRTEAFAELATSLSFEFSAADQPQLRLALGGFHLFNQGHSKKLWTYAGQRGQL